jgi:hypothetical protein
VQARSGPVYDDEGNVISETGGPAPHCNKVAVGGTLLSQGNGMPVRDEIEMAMSFVVAKHVTEGKYHSLRAEYKGTYVGSATCDVADEMDAAKGFQSLDEWALFAPLFITFACTSTGLLVYFVCGYAMDDIHALAEMALNAGDDGNIFYLDDSRLLADMQECSVSQLRARAIAASVPDDGACFVIVSPSAFCVCNRLF